MELQANFGTTPFGGFKKDDVVSYIDEIVTSYSQKIAELEGKNVTVQGDLNEVREIVENQYEKIVSLDEKINESAAIITRITTQNDDLKNQIEKSEIFKQELLQNINDNNKEIDKLTQRIRSIDLAKIDADGIISEANKAAQTLETDAKRKADDIIKSAVGKAAELERDAVENQKEVISRTKIQSDEIISLANIRASENRSIVLHELNEQKQAILASIEQLKSDAKLLQNENKQKAEDFIRNASCEANEILLVATRQADEIKRQINQQFVEEREKYENTMRGVELQKQHIITCIEEIKVSVLSMKTTKPANAISASEVIRRKMNR